MNMELKTKNEANRNISMNTTFGILKPALFIDLI